MYAAKAYQMLGNQQKAESVITTEIQKLRSTGRYEELWAAYLWLRKYTITLPIWKRSGKTASNMATKYFALDIEYASFVPASRFPAE